MQAFYEGQELDTIIFPDGSTFESDTHGKMTVCMEPGQCGYVPWVFISGNEEYNSIKINLSLVSEVHYDDDDDTEPINKAQRSPSVAQRLE